MNGTSNYGWDVEHPNARIESLPHYWKRHDRIFVPFTGFYENWKLFEVEGMRIIYLAAMAKNDLFSIITRPAVGIVKPVHHRMPVILKEPEHFILTGEIREINYDLLKRA